MEVEVVMEVERGEERRGEGRAFVEVRKRKRRGMIPCRFDGPWVERYLRLCGSFAGREGKKVE